MSRLASVSALSLLLCVGTAASWIRSYFVGEVFSRQNDSYAIVVATARGRFYGAFAGPENRGPIGFQYRAGDPKRVGCEAFTVNSGFYWDRLGIGYFFDIWLQTRVIVVPHWLLASVFLVISMGLLRRRACLRRPQHGCASCGYDLRASKDRCPECGTSIQVTASQEGVRADGHKIGKET